jgi:hypothetical protein
VILGWIINGGPTLGGYRQVNPEKRNVGSVFINGASIS